MRVFDAGASGALGSRLVPQLISAGHEVLGTDRCPPRPPCVCGSSGQSPSRATCSMRAVGNAVLDSQPEAIVRLDAANPAVRESLGALRRVTFLTLATRPASNLYSTER